MPLMPAKRWFIRSAYNPDDPSAQPVSADGPLLHVLRSRGHETAEDAHRFLEASLSDDCRFLSYRQKSAIDRAVARIRKAIAGGERIVVYGDFDADGVTSTVLLVSALQALGAQVRPYIPHRVDEGYGLNTTALTMLRSKGVSLVITVDCGIRSLEEVAAARAQRLDVIVTDHHSVGGRVPDAVAVINPKLTDCGYSEPMLAGVGVAYRLAEALLMVESGASRRSGRPLPEPESFLDLVAIGTVADLAPLDRTENRALVTAGLKAMRERPRPGVRALMQEAGLTQSTLSSRDIGFGLGPRINAAGRLESAMLAYDLLMSNDLRECGELASELNRLNRDRQDITAEMQQSVREQVLAAGLEHSPLIFAGDESFRSGIVGLVAGRLCEEFYRPAVVLEYGAEESRASCRSIPEFDISRALDECSDLLIRHGGHAQAAGFTVANANLDALREKLVGIARDWLHGEDLTPSLNIDVELPASAIDESLIAAFERLEPTGQENPVPVFATFNAAVQEARFVGKDGATLKLTLEGRNDQPLDAIGFRMPGWKPERGEPVDIAYSVEMNTFNGRSKPQLHLLDVVPAGTGRVTREARP